MTDLAEDMAKHIAEALNGGEFYQGVWYSEGHRAAWKAAVKVFAEKITHLMNLHDDMADEIERLRGQVEFERKCRNDGFDELKKQDAEIEMLRAALEPLACTCDRPNGDACSRGEVDCPFWQARAALSPVLKSTSTWKRGMGCD